MFNDDTQNFFDYVNEVHCKGRNCMENASSEIKVTLKENFLQVVQSILDLYLKLGLIYKVPISKVRIRRPSQIFKETFTKKTGFVYYLYNGNVFNWQNCSELADPRFWYFRKAIVDLVIKAGLRPGARVFSVGSTKLTSHYDLTVYANPKDTMEIIESFNQQIQSIFNNTSSIIFDTNLYGKGFIEFTEQKGYKKLQCGPSKFYYIPDSKLFHNSQVIWTLVKLIQCSSSALGSTLSGKVYMQLGGSLDLLEAARSRLQFLQQRVVTYEQLLGLENDFVSFYKQNERPLALTDYISMVNFYGTETYYTRGAFMDTVVKTQMCKGKGVKLDPVDILCSVIENAAFFFTHNEKEKYLVRVEKGLSKMAVLCPELIYLCESYSKFLLEITKLNNNSGKICSHIENLSVAKCERYSVYQVLLKVVNKLLVWYSDQRDQRDQRGLPTDFIPAMKFVLK